MSRKISGSHQNDMSVGGPDVAVAQPVSNSDSACSTPRNAEIVPGKKRARGRTAGADVGQLLRGAYRQTVEEAIPDDLLDLLNRLE